MTPSRLTAGPADEAVVRWLRRAVILLLLAGFVAFVVEGANRPANPYLKPSAAAGGRVPVPGFGQIAFRIDRLGGGSRCALLADTAEQQERGLMERHDLSGYDAMLFRFAADSTVGFYMRNTPLPLSIAWFASDGRFVSSADMEPCEDRADCPTFYANGPYRFALEVPRGGLGGLGIGPGAHLSVGGACS